MVFFLNTPCYFVTLKMGCHCGCTILDELNLEHDFQLWHTGVLWIILRCAAKVCGNSFINRKIVGFEQPGVPSQW